MIDYNDDEPHRVWERECNRAVETVLDLDFESQGMAAIEEARRLLVVALTLAGRACETCDGRGVVLRAMCPSCRGSGEEGGVF